MGCSTKLQLCLNRKEQSLRFSVFDCEIDPYTKRVAHRGVVVSVIVSLIVIALLSEETTWHEFDSLGLSM